MIIPDPRPSKAHPEARAARKAFEKEHPHFNMQEFGMKAGALALFAAVTLFPWQKEYEKHERTHHPERFADNNDKDKGSSKDGRHREERRSRRDRGTGRDGDRRRRQSEGGEREREYRMYMDRDREYRPIQHVDTAPSRMGGGIVRGIEEEERYTGSDDGDYGRKYMEASRKERERRERRGVSSEFERRRGSTDYEYRRGSRDERRW